MSFLCFLKQKVPIWNPVYSCAGQAMCSCTHGPWRGIIAEELFLIQLAQVGGHYVATTKLITGRLSIELAKQELWLGTACWSALFWPQMFPWNPGVVFRRPKRVLFHRGVLLATEVMYRRYTLFISLSGWVGVLQESWSDKDVHIIVIILIK